MSGLVGRGECQTTRGLPGHLRRQNVPQKKRCTLSTQGCQLGGEKAHRKDPIVLNANEVMD